MVYLLLAAGFEDIEAVVPIDILRRAKIPVTTVGVTGRLVTSSHGLIVESDLHIDALNAADMDMLILPGGPGVNNLRASPKVGELVRCAVLGNKLVGAICAAPELLAEQGLLNGRRAVCYPSSEETLVRGGAHIERDRLVTHDRNIITAKAAGASIEFALKLVAMISGWPASETVRGEIAYAHLEKCLT